jgi:hypothetical protein
MEKKIHRTKKEKKMSKIKEVANDWNDLADEERAYKKMKQGKISKEDFNSKFYKNF